MKSACLCDRSAAKVSFEGKRAFAASTSLQCRGLSPLPPPVAPSAPPKALRGVNFQPRHHQCSLAEPQFVYSSRYARESRSQTKGTSSSATYNHHGGGRKRDAGLKEVDMLACKDEFMASRRQKLADSGSEFRTRFRPLGCRDGLPAMARYRLSIVERPFRNPQPHDFRPLNEDLGPYTLRTLKTPDPLNIKFRTAQLTKLEGLTHCGQLNSTGEGLAIRRVTERSSQFRTFKTPEPQFVPCLLFPKGRYSPAFAAHDAFLDRIARNIAEN